ncbi:MAG: LemA family protein [bacterium]|nr:LemA family protein [bacterium]
MDASLIILIVIGVVGLWFVATYNGFIRLKQRTEEAESDIEVQQKRRYDLIPNLLEAVKGYAAHEKGVFEKVTEARTRAMATGGTQSKEHQAAENMLSGALKTLFAVSENYPDLKANQNFLELQRELTDTEDKIQAARRFHNSVVMELNTKVESFPSNLVANMFGFTKREFFDLDGTPEQKEPVKIKF